MTIQKILIILKPSPFKIGGLVVLISGLLFYSFGDNKPALLVSLDNQIIDAMFQWRGPRPTKDAVVIVDIDEKSLGRVGQWPWPRTVVADLVKKIDAGGAKAIGFDIVFAERDRSSPRQYIGELEKFLKNKSLLPELEQLRNNEALDHDIVLGNTVADAPVVLGYVFQPGDDGLKQEGLTPFPSLNIKLDPKHFRYEEIFIRPAYRAILNVEDIAQAETEGFFNVFPDSAGTVRKVPLFMKLDGIPYPSLALEVARIGLGIRDITIHCSQVVDTPHKVLLGITLADRFIPTDEAGQLTINYRGANKTFPYVSAIDILEGKNSHRFKDKFVLIGTSAAGLLDLRATPFSSTFPGVEIQANVIDNILANDPFTHDIFTEIGLTYTLIIIGGLLLSGLLAYTGPLVGAIIGPLFIGAAILGNYQFFFLRNELVGLAYPLITVMAVFLSVTLFNYFVEDRQKQFIHGAFSRYVSPQIVGQLIKTPHKLSLAGEQKHLTVLFSDIRGFTSISERMDSQMLGKFMNKYLTAMGDIIMDHDGTVDKFIGDAIMAIWGAPHDNRAHATHAVRTALKMMEKIKTAQEDWLGRGLPLIDIGVGINTGIMSVGNFGSNRRFDYTVLGDNVNLAARLESANKDYGTNVIISEYTKAEIGDHFFCRYLDKVAVKGKTEAVTVYEPLLEGTPDESLSREVADFENSVRDYLAQDFDKAYRDLLLLYQKNPLRLYSVYLHRIKNFLKSPPPPDWDGVERRSHLPDKLNFDHEEE